MTNKVVSLALVTCLIHAISGERANYPNFPQYPSTPISPLTPVNPQSPIDPGLLSGLQYLTGPLTMVTREIGNAAKVIPILGSTIKGLTDGLDKLDNSLTNGNDADAVISLLQTVTGTVDSTAKGLTTTIGLPVHLESVCIVKTVPSIVSGYNRGSYVKGCAESYQVYENCIEEGLLTHTVGSIGSYAGTTNNKWIDYPENNEEALRILLEPKNPKNVTAQRSAELFESYLPDRNGALMRILLQTDCKKILQEFTLVNSLKTTTLLSSIEKFEIPEDYCTNFDADWEELKNSRLGTSLLDFGLHTNWHQVINDIKSINFTEIQNQVVKAGMAEAIEIAKEQFVPKSVSNIFSAFGFGSKKKA